MRIYYATFLGAEEIDLFPREKILQKRFAPVLNDTPCLNTRRGASEDELTQLGEAIKHPLYQYSQDELAGFLRLTSVKFLGASTKKDLCRMIERMLGDRYRPETLPLRVQEGITLRRAPREARASEFFYSRPDFSAVAAQVRPHAHNLENMSIRDLQKIGQQLKIYCCNQLRKHELASKIREALSAIPASE